ncbi:pyrroline-5-carboxylate reductase [Moraxella atlantae]|uniref:Pyrroline-5-carboxylate reductase n=1 Tax=Faucicola atlantae TaxID=34059 RepID=A0A1B8QC01_9GAMM|nr:pyrroline-5-carboxylate reductase [Moraxella atlantae]OBX78262.1 pyrroline-5-carboxylate reductase [Moraxella atlantae]
MAQPILPAAIAFLGGGNMAQALISGLLAQGHPADRLHVADTDTAKLADLAAQGVRIYDASVGQTPEAIRAAEVVVLAVKPQVLQAVLTPLQGVWDRQLVISIVAGIALATLKDWLAASLAVVRAMPNTPAMIQQGATALYADVEVSTDQRTLAEQLLSAVGLVHWLDDETLLDAATAISGSAPAYVFYLLEHMIATGEAMGLNTADAAALALQTAVGAAQMAAQSHHQGTDTPTTLRQKVTSPNGTTQAAIAALDAADVGQAIAQAMHACATRSRQISQEFGVTPPTAVQTTARPTGKPQ